MKIKPQWNGLTYTSEDGTDIGTEIKRDRGTISDDGYFVITYVIFRIKNSFRFNWSLWEQIKNKDEVKFVVFDKGVDTPTDYIIPIHKLREFESTKKAIKYFDNNMLKHYYAIDADEVLEFHV